MENKVPWSINIDNSINEMNHYKSKNEYYEALNVYEHEALDILVPKMKDNESFDEYSDRLVPFIENELKDRELFDTGRRVLRRITMLANENPTEEEYKSLDRYRTKTDCIIDALQKNGFTAYDRDYRDNDDNIMEIPTRNEGESMIDFHERLEQFAYDHNHGKFDYDENGNERKKEYDPHLY